MLQNGNFKSNFPFKLAVNTPLNKENKPKLVVNIIVIVVLVGGLYGYNIYQSSKVKSALLLKEEEHLKRIFKTTTISEQIWMAENINLTLENSYCYNNEPANCLKYGRLYTWEAALAVADKIPGWHLPSDQEWDELCTTLGSKKDSNGIYSDIGTQLEEAGFEALFAGGRKPEGYFGYLNNRTFFWSAASKDDNNAWFYYLIADSSNVYRYASSTSFSFAVRLVKD